MLALVSTTLTNLAYLREHDAAAVLPVLSCAGRCGALTVAGLATLLTNAVPIAAGTIVLDEPVPRGATGGLRLLAFAAVTGRGVA